MTENKNFNYSTSHADSWRVFRIISEFVDGFESLMQIGPSVTIFGSARLQAVNPYYNMAIDVAQKIAERGFAVITGGGPGIMEAANKGAQSIGSMSVGIGIDVPYENDTNRFIDPRYRLKFRYFFIRKVMFIRYAKACVFLPGGLGTLDEFFETVTLIQTQKIKPFPIYLMGTEYWSGLIDWLKKTVLEMGCMSEKDLDLFILTDDPVEVANGIERHYAQDQSLENF
ncbi:uncharacterized protein AF_1126 [Waddlia chondrophila 2032/99]|uniref:Cytokinin riboside 5'-monophosphate phosphoribohydrolase n=2 Tax=Waddlia chondrophila TaxID=71667 RepID=D6YVS7_WADCW|nr:TIGR00730 family Rossman fold protein [Waddlia chondrophila]ADI38238.1 conserved hypothetical protein [Waddlia chondrophila WSU 86-1044]CCB90398.1 uncharacterized protein AF_1126 [Waddlia chondrophila 2032/99]